VKRCAVIASGLRLFAAAAINGTIAHIVPILTDRGIAASIATTAVAAAGLSLIIGPYVAAFFFLVPLIGMTMPGVGITGPACGAGGSASRSGHRRRRRHHGLSRQPLFWHRVYGCILASFTLGSGLGMAHAFDANRSYLAGLIGLAVALLAAVVLVVSLGNYRYPPTKDLRAPAPQDLSRTAVSRSSMSNRRDPVSRT